MPASLPPVPPQPEPIQSAAQAPAFAPAVPPTSAQNVSAVMQARQLVQRYGNDPFQLSEELGRLKAHHLAQQYNILPNGVEN
jgi:hypothetical protein